MNPPSQACSILHLTTPNSLPANPPLDSSAEPIHVLPDALLDAKAFLLSKAISECFSAHNLPSPQTLAHLLRALYPLPVSYHRVQRQAAHILDLITTHVNFKSTRGLIVEQYQGRQKFQIYVSYALIQMARAQGFRYSDLETEVMGEHARCGYRFVKVERVSTMGRDELIDITMRMVWQMGPTFGLRARLPPSLVADHRFSANPPQPPLMDNKGLTTASASASRWSLASIDSGFQPWRSPNSTFSFLDWASRGSSSAVSLATRGESGTTSPLPPSSRAPPPSSTSVAAALPTPNPPNDEQAEAYRAIVLRFRKRLSLAYKRMEVFPDDFFEFLSWNERMLGFRERSGLDAEDSDSAGGGIRKGDYVTYLRMLKESSESWRLSTE